ncbi:MAG: hypothetical protein ACRDDF_10625, partial [Aeromonas sp.]
MTQLGIMTRIKQTKDPAVLCGLNQFIRLSTKLELANCEMDFLEKCIDGNIFPITHQKALKRARIPVTDEYLHRNAQNLKDGMTSLISELNQSLSHLHSNLWSLDVTERLEFEQFVQHIVERQCALKMGKMDKLVHSSQQYTSFPDCPERYVHNLSSITIDKMLLEILSLGPRFCLPGHHTSQLELEVQFECLYSQVNKLKPSTPLDAERLKTTLVTTCYQYLQQQTDTNKLVTKQHLLALKTFKNDKNVLVTRPDKGTGIVLMDKKDYVEKMNCILEDQTKFQLMKKEKDKTHLIEKTISKELGNLKQQGHIDSLQFENLKPTGTHIPRLYGLPKTHKKGVPLR